jgi:hypothetical protein
LGTSQEDILIAGRANEQRLYGGAGDDLLVSIDRGDYMHGGSGADIFAFRFNKNIRRSAKSGKTVDHVIEDFSIDDGDSICLSHLVGESRHKNIDNRGSRRIKGTGIEVRLAQGKQGTAEEEGEAFTGIEDGVEKTLGELPVISKNRQFGADSRLEVYEDGNLISNITLKNTPVSRTFTKKLGKSIFGKYSKTSKEVVSAEGSSVNHLTNFSLTQDGIPLKGNGVKIDVGDHSSSKASALLRAADAIDSNAVSAFAGTIDNSFMKASANVSVRLYQDFEIFGDLFKGTWPSYKLGVEPSINLSISPNVVLSTGNVAGYGSLSFSPNLGITWGEELIPGFNASASGGVQFGASLTLEEEGLDKKVVISPYLSAAAKVAFGHDSMFNTRLAFDNSSHSATASLKESISYEGNGKKDGITGIKGAINFSPSVQFDLGFGYREVEDGVGVTANIIESGPELTYPLAIELKEDDGVATASFDYGPAKLDWVTTLGDVSFSDELDTYRWTGPQYDVGIAEMGPSGSIPLDFSQDNEPFNIPTNPVCNPLCAS